MYNKSLAKRYEVNNKFIFKVRTLVQGIILITRSFAKQII